MGLLPDTWNCGLRMRRECRERLPRDWFQMKPVVCDPGMHHGTCVTHVPWCMSWSLTRDGGKNVPDIPGACATNNITYLSRGPLSAQITTYPIKRFCCGLFIMVILLYRFALHSSLSFLHSRQRCFTGRRHFYNCPSISAVSLKNMEWNRPLLNQNKTLQSMGPVHNSSVVLYTISLHVRITFTIWVTTFMPDK